MIFPFRSPFNTKMLIVSDQILLKRKGDVNEYLYLPLLAQNTSSRMLNKFLKRKVNSMEF